MPELHPIAATSDLGPRYDSTDKSRNQYSHTEAETLSLTDRIFSDSASLQKLQFEDFIYPNGSLEVQETLKKEEVTQDYEEMIEEHVERRILFFFQQLICCYQTKLHFESVGASDQAKSADAIVLKVKGHVEKFAVRNAAHSSTSPRLIAYDKEAWSRYKRGDAPKPEGFVFLKGTDYYRTQQSTMNMPTWINQADREIDEKTSASKLREKAEALVNLASQGEITPEEGISRLIKEALIEIEAAKRRLEKSKKSPEVLQVLQLYSQFFCSFQEQATQDPTFLEKFLNIQFKSANTDPSKKLILKIRYAAIRNVQVKQAELIQKIEKVKQEVLQQVGKPTFFEAAFKTALVESANTKENRHRIEKLLNFSPDQFTAQYDKGNLTKFRNTQKKLLPCSEKIANVSKEILLDMRHMQTEEMHLRSKVTKELRAMQGWTQKELGTRIAKLFPGAASSPSTISRMERGEKLVTPLIAEQLSTVFEVDSGLFMPHFFYE